MNDKYNYILIPLLLVAIVCITDSDSRMIRCKDNELKNVCYIPLALGSSISCLHEN